MVSGIALTALIAGSVVFLSGNAEAQKKKPAFKEIVAGSIPSEFGDLVAFTGQRGQLFMLFKDSDGNLRTVEMTGANKVKGQAYVINRH